MNPSVRAHAWEGRAIDDWRARWGVPAILAFAETGSTNDVARGHAEQGAPAGLLVMTEHQTAGRGRMQKPWADAPGRSLLLSFVLRPSPGAAAASPGTAPLRVGLAVAGALRQAAGLDVCLKWPNDLMSGRGKLGGILCEAASAGGETVIIAGIGINVLQRKDDWPPDLRAHAVSVIEAIALNETGGTAPYIADGPPAPDDSGGARAAASTAPGMHGLRSALMDALTAALRPLFSRPLDPLTDDELGAYARIDALRTLDVTATGSGQTSGIADGIDPDGALLIRTSGGVRRVTSGTVRLTAVHQESSARIPR